MTTEKKNRIAVYGDLTALYNARTNSKKNINYNRLDAALKEYFNVPSFSSVVFYTLYHPENEGQVGFVRYLENELNWKVVTVHPGETRHMGDKKNMNYRFDAQIAYDVGESTVEECCDTIVVISDSIDLWMPLKRAAKYLDEIYLMFFGNAMDKRWWDIIEKNKIENLKFVDLREIMHNRRENEKRDSLDSNPSSDDDVLEEIENTGT